MFRICLKCLLICGGPPHEAAKNHANYNVSVLLDCLQNNEKHRKIPQAERHPSQPTTGTSCSDPNPTPLTPMPPHPAVTRTPLQYGPTQEANPRGPNALQPRRPPTPTSNKKPPWRRPPAPKQCCPTTHKSNARSETRTKQSALLPESRISHRPTPLQIRGPEHKHYFTLLCVHRHLFATCTRRTEIVLHLPDLLFVEGQGHILVHHLVATDMFVTFC